MFLWDPYVIVAEWDAGYQCLNENISHSPLLLLLVPIASRSSLHSRLLPPLLPHSTLSPPCWGTALGQPWLLMGVTFTRVTASFWALSTPWPLQYISYSPNSEAQEREKAKIRSYSGLCVLCALVQHLYLSSADLRRMRHLRLERSLKIKNNINLQPLAGGGWDRAKPDWEENTNSSNCLSGNPLCLRHQHVWHTQALAGNQILPSLCWMQLQNKWVLTLTLQGR